MLFKITFTQAGKTWERRVSTLPAVKLEIDHSLNTAVLKGELDTKSMYIEIKIEIENED